MLGKQEVYGQLHGWQRAKRVWKGRHIVDGKGTFFIHVVGCQNATWQGTITWIEEKEKQYFRSALEMIKLIDAAIGENQSKDSSSEDEQRSQGDKK